MGVITKVPLGAGGGVGGGGAGGGDGYPWALATLLIASISRESTAMT
jgi:hypothetical protein